MWSEFIHFFFASLTPLHEIVSVLWVLVLWATVEHSKSYWNDTRVHLCEFVFPRQFIIDIMLSVFFSFFLCVFVYGYVCRRAHVQEMWDRLCFYWIASPKIDGIRLQSTSCSRIIHSTHFIIDCSFITFHQDSNLRDTKSHFPLPVVKILYLHLNLLSFDTHCFLLYCILIFFFYWFELTEKYVWNLPSHVNWP